jgi:hypothetical protein
MIAPVPNLPEEVNIVKSNPPHVCAVALMLLATGCISSLAFAQEIEPFREEIRAKPKKETDKIGFLYKASDIYLSGATLLDMSSTVRVLHHPTTASRTDGSVLARYQGEEVGWASFLGKRNTGAAVGANVLLNVGMDLLGRRLYRRGGHWKILAVAVNVLKGTDNLMAGVHNIRYSSNIDGNICLATGYTGRVIWSH